MIFHLRVVHRFGVPFPMGILTVSIVVASGHTKAYFTRNIVLSIVLCLLVGLLAYLRETHTKFLCCGSVLVSCTNKLRPILIVL